MLEWTGERFVPWLKEAAVAYEHLHRYMWAAGLVKGKRVLDLASGEGYGSAILAADAASVVGVDLDENSTLHASKKYSSPGLRFLTGSVTRVPLPEDHSFDVIVCFEALEHIREHGELLAEVKRLLSPGGLFLVSTPNTAVYKGKEEGNPFHVRELSFAEFRSLLAGHFGQVALFGQEVHPASSLWRIGAGDDSPIREFPIERRNEEFSGVANESRVARYLVAAASDSSVEAIHGSVLVDDSNELLVAKDRQLQEATEGRTSAEAGVLWLREKLAEVTEALHGRERQVRDLEQSLEAASKELAEIHVSRGWRFVLWLRALRERLGISKS